MRPDAESMPKNYEILILDFCGHLLLPEFEKTEGEDYQHLSELLDELREHGRETCQVVETLFEL